MTVDNVIAVLGWCMVVNFSVLLLWFASYTLVPELTYRTQQWFTPIRRDDFDKIFYRLMGQFKLGIILLNFAPYVALRIVY